MTALRVLIGCEESQIVAQAFRALGHEAMSCDLLPTRGNPDYHLQGDVIEAVIEYDWDLIILHPDCTALAVSGNRWYGKGKRLHHKRIQQIEWTRKLWARSINSCDHVALENPVSIVFQRLYKGSLQYIQPWQFGHGETKKTGLYLFSLPELQPTNIVEGRENRIWKMAPSETRKRDRSETYSGIAAAMAYQWSRHILKARGEL